MKKVICMLLCAVLMLSGVVSAFAENWVEYDLPEMSMSVYIPDSFYAWTRNLEKDSPILEETGYDHQYLMDVLSANNAYLDAVSKDNTVEILFTSIDSPFISDLGQLEQSYLDLRVSAILEQIESLGVKVSNYEMFEHPQATFLKYYYEQPIDQSINFYGARYYTVYNNKEIDIQTTSFYGELTESQDSIFDNIVASIEFSESENPIQESGTVYTDLETGMSFVIPAGFKEIELTAQQRQSADARFDNQNGNIIIYTSADMWRELASDNKKLKERSQANINCISEKELLGIGRGMGYSSSQMTRIQKGEYEFIEFNGPMSRNNLSVDTRTDITVIDGYLYMFMTTAFQKSGLDSVYESLSSLKPAS